MLAEKFRVSMDDQAIAMLGVAAAVPSPLRLRVRTATGAETDYKIASSFAVIGRGENCDIRLPDNKVSGAHVYLQAIGSRLACVDLISVAGIQWSGPPFQGWVSPEHSMQIGPYELTILDSHWAYEGEVEPPLDFRPRHQQRPEYGLLPQVELELLNTPAKGKRWPINRVITLIGRDERCRITVMDDRLARVHCGLLLLPTGLWVINFNGADGVLVNGEPCRCGMLATGTELSIGPYKMTAHYPQSTGETPLSHPFSSGNANEFLTRPNRIFQVDFYHDTLVVTPLSDNRKFFFQDVHIEASRIVDLITQRGFHHVVVDFSQVSQLNHLVQDGLLSICRSAPGKSVLCGADDAVLSLLQNSALNRLYDHYASREEAVQAIYLSD